MESKKNLKAEIFNIIQIGDKSNPLSRFFDSARRNMG